MYLMRVDQKGCILRNPPKDFFYFYSELKKNNIKTGFIELQNNNSKNIPLNLFKIFEKIFIRFFNCPFMVIR